jgi:hypothetical protein
MWITTPDSSDYSLINLCDYELLDVLPHEGGDHVLVAFEKEDYSIDPVCIKCGTKNELFALMCAIGTVNRCSKYAPTTATLH